MSYSEAALERKLSDLNNSQQSIQQLSLWLIHHRKHHEATIKIWYKEILKTSPARKLTFLYLANDVVQNSKRKHPEFAKEFGPIMKKVLEHLSLSKLDDKTIQSIARLLTIWKERSIFEDKIQTELQRIWTKKTLSSAADEQNEIDEPKTPPMKKAKKEAPTSKSSRSSTSSRSSGEGRNGSSEIKKVLETSAILSQSLEERIVSPTPADPPEPEELIKALQDLENSASSDAIIREKIAKLPSEVSEPTHLNNLQSFEEGQRLLVKVNEATDLLTNYNQRLQQELKDRCRVGRMMADFLAAQKDLLSQAEERIELYRDKLDKLNSVREDLKSHIQSLPDLTKLPDVTGGLAPLPSAGDLFTVK